MSKLIIFFPKMSTIKKWDKLIFYATVTGLMIHPVIGRLKLLLAYIYLGQFQTVSDLSARFEAPKQRTDHKSS